MKPRRLLDIMEASLIQKLEKEGVGRPSTYSSIISTIQDRGYIKKIGRALAPTFTAIAVTQFLSEHFPNYVDLKFTSEMEKKLDDIEEGQADHIKYLASIYRGEKGLALKAQQKTKEEFKQDPRTLLLPNFQDVSFHVGRFGAYLRKKIQDEEVKVSLPEDMFPADLDQDKLAELIKVKNQQGFCFWPGSSNKRKHTSKNRAIWSVP